MIQAVTEPRVTVTQRPANELAVSITGRPYVSWSQINCMRRCPRLFAFRYVEHAAPWLIPSSIDPTRIKSLVVDAVRATWVWPEEQDEPLPSTEAVHSDS